MQAVSLRPRLAILQNGPIRKSCGALRCSVSVRAEGPRVTREYREGDDKIINTPSETPAASEAKPNSAFIDDLPEVRENFKFSTTHASFPPVATNQPNNPIPLLYRSLAMRCPLR